MIVAANAAALPASADPAMEIDSNLFWDVPEPWFGGFSGLEVSPDGQSLTIISDRGVVATARLIRSSGTVTAIELLSVDPLRQADGTVLQDGLIDAEGLAIGADGRAFISFENEHRVMAFDLSQGITTPLAAHKDFEQLDYNTGLEALAIHPDGRLFTLSEGKADETGTTPLYQLHGGRWTISHRVPLKGPFVPVGADFDDNGSLYLLERTLSPLGFRSRIRRFDLDAGPNMIETLVSTVPGTFDNLEALSVWRDPMGQTRLMLISDDNFLSLQRTQIVEYIVKE
ncbi:MAG: esterase-like activity of phytase family protein [Sulfitobacter sp.]|nr:esterase-like activity of phytase family protein [Sulfitobacter sp.]